MQVGRAAPAPAPASTQAEAKAEAKAEADARLSRRLYLPTLVIAALTAWLSWRGWSALDQTGLASRPIPVEQAGRLGRTMLTQLAEPFTSIH